MKKREKYRPISLMNIDAKSSKEYWQTKYNNTLEGSYTMIKWDSFEMQGFFNTHNPINVIHHINKLKNKNPTIISIDTETVLTKIQYPSMI